MARRPEEYLADILEAAKVIRGYTRKGKQAFLRDAMTRDAVIARILQIGEAVKAAQAGGIDLEARAPEIPWRQIAGMRDLLSHQYWRTDPEILWAVVANDVKPLQSAVQKMRSQRVKRRRKT
jgi:uncharacterized protein with HEPN domain